MINVLIDTNIFLYFFYQSISEAKLRLIKKFFKEIENKKVHGIITTRILDEIYFKTIIIKAKEIYPQKTLQKFKNDKKLLKKLTYIYDKINEMSSQFNIEVKILTFDDYKTVSNIQKEYGIIGNDAISLAVMKRDKLDYIATFDNDFKTIKSIKNYLDILK